MIYFDNRDVRLEMPSVRRATDSKLHSHDEYEIGILVEGERRFFIHKDIYQVQVGDVILIPPGVPHEAITVTETYSRYLLYFPQNYIKEKILLSCFEDAVITMSRRRYNHVQTVISQICGEMQKTDAYRDICVEMYLKNLLMLFCRYREKKSVREFSHLDKNVQKAAIYIRSHYRENISLGEIASEVFLSPNYLSKRFKEVTGFGVKEYITAIRLREAELLLTGTNNSIADIADACGFGDPNYFGDAFRKIKGVSPQQFRKENTPKLG